MNSILTFAHLWDLLIKITEVLGFLKYLFHILKYLALVAHLGNIHWYNEHFI